MLKKILMYLMFFTLTACSVQASAKTTIACYSGQFEFYEGEPVGLITTASAWMSFTDKATGEDITVSGNCILRKTQN